MAQEEKKFTLEALGGVSMPMGSAKDTMKLGYDVLIGAGWKFTPAFTALVEFQYNRFSLTRATLTANNEPGGFTRFFSFNLSPRYYIRPHRKLSEYVTAGGGLYGRELIYNDPSQVQTYCDPYNGEGCETSSPPVLYSNTTYRSGFDAGGGIAYSPFDTRVKLVTDIRYNRVMSRSNNSFVTLSLGFVY